MSSYLRDTTLVICVFLWFWISFPNYNIVSFLENITAEIIGVLITSVILILAYQFWLKRRNNTFFEYIKIKIFSCYMRYIDNVCIVLASGTNFISINCSGYNSQNPKTYEAVVKNNLSSLKSAIDNRKDEKYPVSNLASLKGLYEQLSADISKIVSDFGDRFNYDFILLLYKIQEICNVGEKYLSDLFASAAMKEIANLDVVKLEILSPTKKFQELINLIEDTIVLIDKKEIIYKDLF